jgi:PAS domain S-box-containing protein
MTHKGSLKRLRPGHKPGRNEPARTDSRRSSKRRNDIAQQYLDVASVVFVALDGKGNITLINRKGCALLGYSEGELVGRNWFETCVPKSERKRAYAVFRKIIAGTAAALESYENPVVTRTGEERLVAWRNTVLVDEHGNPSGTLSSGEDVTEARLAQERMRILLQGLPDTVLYQTGGGVEYVSDNIETMLGYPAKDFARDRTFLPKLIHPDDRERLRTSFRAWLKAGAVGVHEAEFRVRRRDGRYIWLLDRSRVAFRTPAGRHSTIGVMLDITARKQVEQELATYRESLEELAAARTRELRRTQEQLLRRERLAALGEIAGSIAHELRNPLGAIRNATYFLNMVLTRELKDRAGRHLEIINDEIERSDRIITALLDYARGRPCNPAPSDLAEIIEDAMGMAHLPQGIRVRNSIPQGLPQVNVDDSQVTQVFANLLTNAAQALCGRGMISIAANRVNGHVRVSVSDNGPGIAPENMQRMFEPLFSTKAFGVGLGLPVCKSFIEANSGSIEVESEPGKGATFTVSLPVAMN